MCELKVRTSFPAEVGFEGLRQMSVGVFQGEVMVKVVLEAEGGEEEEVGG